ncbi:flagellar hook-basal body complex protein [Hyphomonas sp. FCG-A18]|jgi:flagellar basal-body rod protein FlgF|uniref:flagellar hook-basal body complex protein n=1 Tax=Hyphomonas sp. FCG-A18 TaxID=3080019 RepID=UPI002B29D36B|nr:flagellar hook-basal body complex protein [Hyphomonas sp. FCG-A18]
MSNPIYAAISRQDGLSLEMRMIANNLANSSTTGYKADKAVFSEFIVPTGQQNGSLSMGRLAADSLQLDQGSLRFTGGQFDVALQGEGFFSVETDRGVRLTRAGHFQLNADGTLIDQNGYQVLSAGGAPITVPPEAAQLTISSDGTISADGAIVDQIGVVQTEGALQRDADTLFIAQGDTQPIENPRMLQGALEQSNVSPVLEVARMIEVQRAYEAGQAMMDREDQRLTQLISAVRNQQ